MSELKAGVITTPHNEGMSFNRDSDHVAVTEEETEFYLKFEADAVLAEKDKEIVELKCQVNGFKNRSNLWHFNSVEEHKKLVKATMVIDELKADYKEAIDRLQTANLIKDEQLAATRHQKYKRCLAMSEWCDAEADVDDADGDYEDMRWYQKWHERWLKLAEQFKEAKCR